jgi:hypothetical protein
MIRLVLPLDLGNRMCMLPILYNMLISIMLMMVTTMVLTLTDICHVLATNQGSSGRKGRSFEANETSTTLDKWKSANTIYFLNKGETIAFQGYQYFTHSTMICALVNTSLHLTPWLSLTVEPMAVFVVLIFLSLKGVNILLMSVEWAAIGRINYRLAQKEENHKDNVIAYIIRKNSLVWVIVSCSVFNWNIMVQRLMTSLFDYQVVCK